jgi:hypothetical protein
MIGAAHGEKNAVIDLATEWFWTLGGGKWPP